MSQNRLYRMVASLALIIIVGLTAQTYESCSGSSAADAAKQVDDNVSVAKELANDSGSGHLVATVFFLLALAMISAVWLLPDAQIDAAAAYVANLFKRDENAGE